MSWRRRAMMTSIGMSLLTRPARADTGAATETFEFGGVSVERTGKGGRPMIFIPGLAGGAWSWEDMVRRFAGTHEVYALTLPGFSGKPAAKPPLIDMAVKAIIGMIKARNLHRPVLIGHSLGGFIAWRIAVEAASLVGGVVALDGYPVFPPLADASPADRVAAAGKLAASLGRGMNQAQFQDAIRAFLRARTTDPAKADAMAEISGKSDPEAVADYITEMLPADLRPRLARARVPILSLVATESYKKGMPEAEMKAFYEKLLANAPFVSVVLIHGARHFVETDQPETVGVAIETFVDGLDRWPPRAGS